MHYTMSSLMSDPVPKVRLFGGDIPSDGIIELDDGYGWGTVCELE